MKPVLTLTAKDLRVAYDNHVALTIESLQASGTIVALLGHNGAGKSTFIKSVLHLLPARQGSLIVSSRYGESETRLTPEQHMAFCPETGAVFSDITVESYIRLWCRFKHRDPNFYRKAGRRYLDMLAVEPLMNKRGRELSKGQRRRVQTAIGFLIEPALFLFDEPFDGLDVQRTTELAEIIARESDQRSVILSSHRMDVIERLADYVIVLKHGAVAALGSVGEVCSHLCPQSIRVTGIVDAATAHELLRRLFSSCVVNRIGDQITLSGRAANEHDIAGALKGAALELTRLRIERVPASLVDAMTFHLREVELLAQIGGPTRASAIST